MRSNEELNQELNQVTLEIFELQNRKRELMAASDGEVVQDYAFRGTDGSVVRMSDLFGDKTDLILIHNMGKECIYCTLWADGFNGLAHHLEDRAGFVVGSPNEPATVREFAHSRNWQFKMVSVDDEFLSAMGMYSEKDGYLPGISTFKRFPDGTIKRMNWSYFDPGDPFCSLWHMFDMLPDGDNNWEPKYDY